jgi:hypothetical protein
LFGVVCGELVPRPDLPPALHVSWPCAIDGGGGTISDAEAHGVLAYKLRINDVTIDHAGQEGIYAIIKGRLENVTITNSGDEGARIDHGAILIGSTITGSGTHGLSTRTAKVVASTLTGNGIGPDCVAPTPCADLATPRRPKLRDASVCGNSLNTSTRQFSDSWHVCQFD